MLKTRIAALLILIVGFGIGWFVYSSELVPEGRFNFKLGLDLTGGSHLVYGADTSDIAPNEVSQSMEALRDVIERRVNLFGVSEPIVQVERASVVAGGESDERLIVELPGISDVNEAIALIGATPVLEFKLIDLNAEMGEDGTLSDEAFIDTGLTGRLVNRAQLQFGTGAAGGLSNEPVVILSFNNEGADLFEQITTDHVGEQLAIFLDGELKSSPVIQEPIPGGQATITGDFTPEEARTLVRDLNFGALPVPIELLSTQSVGASLGAEAFDRGALAGMFGLLAVAIFLVVWYRAPGVLAVLSLGVYITIMLAIFKLIPVVLTAAGVAGFILSIGLAVDANILIFERMKEELSDGKDLHNAIRDGFARAWQSIRDGNISSILTAIILFWFGTSIVEGFALTFGLGVIISMLSAITITRTFLLATAPKGEGWRGLFKSGFSL